MLLFTPHITPRLSYVVQYLNEQLGWEAQLTTDEQLFRSHRTEKLNYSHLPLTPDAFHIKPVGLLAAEGIRRQTIACFPWAGTLAFFKTEEDDLGFDLFSALFYLLSRYEEYNEYEPDAYGRYAHTNALAWKEGVLNQPLVDQWLQVFRRRLQQKLPHLKLRQQVFSFLPTYDIDIAWSWREKAWWRLLGGALREPRSIPNRLQVLLGRHADPYDCYSWLDEQHRHHQLQPLYFFLMARQRDGLDKNIHPRNSSLRRLIIHTAETAAVGLHPSVFSNTHPGALPEEKQLLEQVTGHAVTCSRHHYLRVQLPHSYRQLLAAGITHDYSMGYGTVNGFRASTSRSFLWYDLEQEQTTQLRVHPLAFMDANALYEAGQTPGEALQELTEMYNRIKEVQGTCITVFHNHILGTGADMAGWREMYAAFLEEVAGATSVTHL
ncbi:MAG TPA: polysaccharide deacetylase family protein [Lacibacter sp.]|nr:polysaccharide deacetylase family protein [Lacibacter sp.]HMO88110.1 polysaccharide deacetylase family protein [Lacibacter sp.]HMP87207.1 polysaccharide deacetylase family protein [Lacibacter sp.]